MCAEFTAPRRLTVWNLKRPQRRFDGRKQICVTEWLEQKPSRAFFEH